MKPVHRKPGAVPSISAAEWEVMRTLWAGKPLAARDVYAALPRGHGWAVKTVKTLLARLVAKGAVEYEQIGNSYLYRAAVSRDKVTRHEVRGFVEGVLDGSLAPILHFIEDRGELTDEEVAQLERLLKRKQAAGDAAGRRKKS